MHTCLLCVTCLAPDSPEALCCCAVAKERPGGDHSPVHPPGGDDMVVPDSQEDVSQPLVTPESGQKVGVHAACEQSADTALI